MNEKAMIYLSANARYFDESVLPALKEKIEKLPDDKFLLLQSVQLQDPTMLLVVSLLAGTLGIDRFLVGDTGLGVLKLLTGGCCGIFTFIDWFLIMRRTKEQNLNKIMMVL